MADEPKAAEKRAKAPVPGADNYRVLKNTCASYLDDSAIEKIEQLLMLDLRDPDVRFNLYAALRVQEILVDMHILPGGYVGRVHEKLHSSEAATGH